MPTKQIADNELTTDKTMYVDRRIKPDSRSLEKTVSFAAQDETVPKELRSLDIITDELIACKSTFVESAYMSGKLLIEGKEQLKENESWLAWLHKVGIPERTAQRLMRLAKGYSDPTALSDLGMTKALTLLTIPEEERDAFIEDIHEVNGVKKTIGEMSCREVGRAIQEHKNKRNDTLPINEAPPDNDSTERADSTDAPEPGNSDPVVGILGGILHLEKTIKNVLEILDSGIDDPNEYNELNNRLRKILHESLQKLPPAIAVSEDQPK